MKSIEPLSAVSALRNYLAPLAFQVKINIDEEAYKPIIEELANVLSSEMEKASVMQFVAKKVEDKLYTPVFACLVMMASGAMMRDMELFSTATRLANTNTI